MQMSGATVEKLGRHLTRQAQHPFVASKCGERGGAGVENSRTWDDGKDRGSARRPCVTECHVAARLLMPCTDELDIATVNRIEQSVRLCSRKSEDGVDAMRF